uniref:Uncharacterized protein n=1 Tax=Anopheles albimanus TaxID=7167 RepID=A0A182FAI9_ANOAL
MLCVSNGPTYLNASLHDPNQLDVTIRSRKSSPPCTPYPRVVWALDYPKSIPSGDYRKDISTKDAKNATIYAMHFQVNFDGTWNIDLIYEA